MHRDELWTIVAETYAVHFMLFGCGLLAEEVFVSVGPVLNAPTRFPYANVIARKNGREFRTWIAALPRRKDERDFRAAWSLFSHRQPQMPRDELDTVIACSMSYSKFPAFRQQLIDKGLVGLDAGTELLATWQATVLLAARGPSGDKPS